MARKTKQQALETRQHILDAAVQEFSERGVSATSLTDIATAAGVTRGAIYWHFKNKVDLFNEVWELSESKIGDLELEYQAKFPENPLRILREILIYILTATVDDSRRRALMEIVFHKCEFVGEMMPLHEARKVLYLAGYERIESVLRDCMAHGQLPVDLHTRRAAIILHAYITGLMENWLFMPESFDLKAEATALIDSFLEMVQFSPALRIKPEELATQPHSVEIHPL
ncbi:Potential acrAB operon repressor [Serratia quinivorans]|jgi:TetR/AcrR family acrAB operon transcriptional repressor|uniref:Multidrug efflux transporter transcriptional repressor AcrR n=1 Tax=Serratia quinivorans TaxID=137545 RepID=A0ABV3UCP5_9GAMM|nr:MULTISPECIES: multidrug efflux transporter transcriptional repressor AcrR [Serratia]MBV6690504.1 multidrug efflux transporter transcriptional repressor AcrR [Serratia quinivorans]CAI0891375.1 Potential acrAB operon repressor [Serratia quinivorans]CAI1582742.1 Potential acrAB operon repressor [Serratia quinivorans]CAI1775433.1 Potential acrAB operon repressor [Serratia quinivorans]CAI1854352.1 Potential acrAB operon repressor [Serratia quinivorans]